MEYTLVGSEVWTTVTNDWHSFSYEIGGLQRGARYVFRVRAVNVHGPSKPSMESEVVQLDEDGEFIQFKLLVTAAVFRFV